MGGRGVLYLPKSALVQGQRALKISGNLLSLLPTACFLNCQMLNLVLLLLLPPPFLLMAVLLQHSGFSLHPPNQLLSSFKFPTITFLAFISVFPSQNSTIFVRDSYPPPRGVNSFLLMHEITFLFRP